MMNERRECKALAGPNSSKQPRAAQPARADAAIRNFFVAVGNLGNAGGGKRGGRTTAAPSPRGAGGKTGGA